MLATLILLIANVVFTYMGFSKPEIMSRYKFHVERILGYREYDRMFTSGFLHVGWGHLVMNMMSLYFMGGVLERFYCESGQYGAGLGIAIYLIVYVGSLLGGDALALLMRRNDGNYTAVGASGAISGVIFALLVIAPDNWLAVFFIPMPFWLFGIIYVGFSLFGIGAQFGRIGHEAHLGGALVGLLLGCLFAPQQALEHWIFLTALAVPTMFILYGLYRNPNIGSNPLEWLKSIFAPGGPRPSFQQNPRSQSTNPFDVPVKQDGLEVNRRAMMQRELDILLDRVSRKGYHTLSAADRARLDELGRELNKNTDMSGGRAPNA